eukprot:gnl/Chilomastix_cuspidata/2151.p1 GENE.gnl/Chilomastix_cuspidata/2151~~gnl/Chilomastix_cuspidata/2151.p1  ORF type:complete len:1047 (-),score=160.19 gnl/Chilomastix_cuspidata/2151:84-2936(-)
MTTPHGTSEFIRAASKKSEQFPHELDVIGKLACPPGTIISIRRIAQEVGKSKVLLPFLVQAFASVASMDERRKARHDAINSVSIPKILATGAPGSFELVDTLLTSDMEVKIALKNADTFPSNHRGVVATAVVAALRPNRIMPRIIGLKAIPTAAALATIKQLDATDSTTKQVRRSLYNVRNDAVNGTVQEKRVYAIAASNAARLKREISVGMAQHLIWCALYGAAPPEMVARVTATAYRANPETTNESILGVPEFFGESLTEFIMTAPAVSLALMGWVQPNIKLRRTTNSLQTKIEQIINTIQECNATQETQCISAVLQARICADLIFLSFTDSPHCFFLSDLLERMAAAVEHVRALGFATTLSDLLVATLRSALWTITATEAVLNKTRSTHVIQDDSPNNLYGADSYIAEVFEANVCDSSALVADAMYSALRLLVLSPSSTPKNLPQICQAALSAVAVAPENDTLDPRTVILGRTASICFLQLARFPDAIQDVLGALHGALLQRRADKNQALSAKTLSMAFKGILTERGFEFPPVFVDDIKLRAVFFKLPPLPPLFAFPTFLPRLLGPAHTELYASVSERAVRAIWEGIDCSSTVGRLSAAACAGVLEAGAQHSRRLFRKKVLPHLSELDVTVFCQRFEECYRALPCYFVRDGDSSAVLEILAPHGDDSEEMKQPETLPRWTEVAERLRGANHTMRKEGWTRAVVDAEAFLALYIGLEVRLRPNVAETLLKQTVQLLRQTTALMADRPGLWGIARAVRALSLSLLCDACGLLRGLFTEHMDDMHLGSRLCPCISALLDSFEALMKIEDVVRLEGGKPADGAEFCSAFSGVCLALQNGIASRIISAPASVFSLAGGLFVISLKHSCARCAASVATVFKTLLRYLERSRIQLNIASFLNDTTDMILKNTKSKSYIALRHVARLLFQSLGPRTVGIVAAQNELNRDFFNSLK